MSDAMDTSVLLGLPAHRRVVVEAWLNSELNPCRHCDEPVRPVDPRAADPKYPIPPAPPDETPDEKQHRVRPRVAHLACSHSDASGD
jgi:hypothetical protein